jgi:hypothetical protein
LPEEIIAMPVLEPVDPISDDTGNEPPAGEISASVPIGDADSVIGDSAVLLPTTKSETPIQSPSLAPLEPPPLPLALVAPPVAVAPPAAERFAVPAKAPSGRKGLAPEPPPRWLGRMHGELAAHVVRPTAKQVETVYWLAAVLLFSVIFGAAPALGHWKLTEAPAWAQALMLVAAAELTYIAWLIVLPDWSTVRVGMVLFAAVAVSFAATTFLLGSPSLGEWLPFDLSGAGTSAFSWCGANAVVMGLLGFACGRLAAKWRRAEFDDARGSRNPYRAG